MIQSQLDLLLTSRKRGCCSSIFNEKNILLSLFFFLLSRQPLTFTSQAFNSHSSCQTTHRSTINRNTRSSISPFIHYSNDNEASTILNLRKDESWFDDNEIQKQRVRFLGKGKNAIIRPGVVLVAPNHEYNHYLKKAAVFVHAIGLNDYGEHATRGVIIDHPTAFTMGEMSAGSVVGVLGSNILFQGGDQGKDKAIMLHSLGDECIGCGEMIGTSGIYEGGLNAALEAADEGEADPENIKFFFNHVEFSDSELVNMLNAEDSEGDAWISVEAPIKMILDSDLDKGDAWKSLRNQLKQMTV